jgi:hypothetical protein
MEDIDAGKKICSFLEKKRVLFNQYLLITKRMKESLKNKEAGSSGVFISERQDCIKRIERIDLSIENIINASSDRLKHISDKLKGLIDSYLSSIKSIMETVDLIDKELMVMVKEESESIKEELLKMRKFQQAARGYRRDKKYSPRFLDTIR